MINIERRIPKADLPSEVEKITMLRDASVYPYENSDIDIVSLGLNDFRPIQLYVLKKALLRQYNLRKELLEQGHDTLRLEEGLRLNNDGYRVGMIPPVVEEDSEYGYCLLDGAHRAYLAKELGHKSLSVLRIRNVPTQYPLAAYPNEWGDMVEYDKLPARESLRRRYRSGYQPDKLFRDLSCLTGEQGRMPGDEV